jgi:hypothetical protein
MNGATWSKISLSQDEVSAGHVDRLQDSFAQVLIEVAASSGAAMFGAARPDGGEDLYFTPSASAIAEDLLKGNGAVACPPPLNEGDMALLVGEDGDARLLSS